MTNQAVNNPKDWMNHVIRGALADTAQTHPHYGPKAFSVSAEKRIVNQLTNRESLTHLLKLLQEDERFVHLFANQGEEADGTQ